MNTEYKEYIEQYRNVLSYNRTPKEIECEKILYDLGIDSLSQHIIKINDNQYYIVDIYIPNSNVILEIDGGIHNVEEVHNRDIERTKLLESKGYKVYRVKNEQVTKVYIRKLLKKINVIDTKKISINS